MPDSSWTESGSSISLVPATTTIDSGSSTTNVNYLTNSYKISLMAQYAAELATKTSLDELATTWSVSSTYYDNAVAAISTALIAAGAPSDWATTWPDGTTSGPWTGIQTSLANLWAQVATQRTAAANAASAISAAQAALKTAFFLGKWWNLPFPSGGGDLTSVPAAVTIDQNINYSTPLSGTPDYPWQNVSTEPSGMTITTNFYARWTGYVTAGEAGTYTFGVNSDDGANLYVNGTQLISNLPNGQTADDTSCAYMQSGTIALSAGQTVPIILEWENMVGPGGIQFIMIPPGGPAQLAVAGTSTISGSSITAGSITANQIAAGAITTALIAAGAITTALIAAGAITAVQIAAGAITADMITAGTLNAANVAVINLNASNIVTGTLSATRVLFADGTSVSTANRVQTVTASPTTNNTIVSPTTTNLMSATGYSWTINAASASDVYNVDLDLLLTWSDATSNDYCNILVCVDGVTSSPAISNNIYVQGDLASASNYRAHISGTITGLSAGAHTIQVYLEGDAIAVWRLQIGSVGRLQRIF